MILFMWVGSIIRIKYTIQWKKKKFFLWGFSFHCLQDALLQSVICSNKTCGEAVPFLVQKPGPYKCLICGTKIPANKVADAESLMVKAETALRQMEERATVGDYPGAVQLADPIFRRAAGLLHPKNFTICSLSLLCSSAYTAMVSAIIHQLHHYTSKANVLCFTQFLSFDILSIDWSLDWSIDRSLNWLIDWLIDWSIYWSFARLIDWLIDWSRSLIFILADWCSIDCLISEALVWVFDNDVLIGNSTGVFFDF